MTRKPANTTQPTPDGAQVAPAPVNEFQEDPDPALKAAAQDAEAEANAKLATKSVISADRKRAYGKDQSNGDLVATSLKGVPLTELRSVAEKAGIEWRWDHLNPGMQRMNVGNRIRAVLKAGKSEFLAAWIAAHQPSAA